MQNKTIQGFKLSPQQKQLWLLEQSGSGPSYRARCAILLEGDVKTDVLKEAAHRVISRHEILRTTFHKGPGMKIPFQVIADHPASMWRDVDLSHLEPQRQQARVEEFFQEEANHPFDFEQGPLLRMTLLGLSASKRLLLVSLPSICADAWTLRNMAGEIGGSYAALLKDEELSGEALQYADYAEWQNELLAADDAEAGKQYWRNRDVSSLPHLSLPFELRPREKSAREPQSVLAVIAPVVAAKVEALASKYDATARTYLLTCWQTLLWRLTGQADIVVGSMCDCRRHEELQQAMGLFAKCLPSSTRFEGDYRFSEILRHVHQSESEAYDWQEYFASEQSATPDREGAATIGFELEERPRRVSFPEVSVSIYKQHSWIYPFKLKLSCFRVDDYFIAEFSYDTALYRREDVERVAQHFETLVTSATRNSEATVDRLRILSERERHQLLIEFNRTAVDYQKDICIHHLFEGQAERTPDAVAVVFEDHRLSYAELNASANRLAHLLRQRGVGPDSSVGLCLDRSEQMIVGLLGILKAGGAYVPLNPEHPKARLSHQLSETQTLAVLTEQRLLDRLPDLDGEIIALDRDDNLLKHQPCENPNAQTVPQHLAYVIYTSGSTGKPKGVAISHESLVNYTHFICEKLRVDAASHGKPLHFATVSTIGADLGNTCIFPSLVSGGCLHIIGQDTATEGDLFADYISGHSIDVLKITPTHLSALMAAQDHMSVLPGRHLILGGEALSLHLAERISNLGGDCKLINHYGPTETTVGSLTFSLGENDDSSCGNSTIPIGRPIANTEVYILDQNLEPSPVGVPGELYIGGAGLARGYLNRPEMTAEKFVPDPFSNRSGSRLYKTGDQARYLPDGNVEFIGRNDHQVKIRGFRVELGEIEAALAHHPAVRQSVVVAREDVPGDVRLIAYIAASLEAMPTVEGVRGFLREELPDYMVPALFVMMKSLPLTANGKVDRRALPSPEQAGSEKEKVFVGPRTSVEEAIEKIWAEVLRLSKVSIHDNFFELGGHSLLVTQVISRLRKVFRVELPLRSLFESPTIAQLAERIEAAEREEADRTLAELENLSDEEAERLLELEMRKEGSEGGVTSVRQVSK
jgi:amino acid adenylation domain-containing protein